MSDIEITESDASIFNPERLQKRIEAGEIFILRGMREISALVDIIARLAGRYFDTVTDEEIREIIHTETLPDDRRVAAIARALRRARNEYLGTTLFLPFIDALNLAGPVQVEAGIARIRTTPEVYERLKPRTDLIPAIETAPAAAPDLVPPVFALKNAPPHRDIHRPHYTTQMNLWFCLHDAAPGKSLTLFPEAYINPNRPDLSDPANPVSYGLGRPFSPDLRFGDALLFSSEHYHASPIHQEDKARYSWDIRLVAGCWDDNRHYRENFLPIDALRPFDATNTVEAMIEIANFAADHPNHAPGDAHTGFQSQRLCLAWLEQALSEGDTEAAESHADTLLRADPAEQIAYSAAERALSTRPDLAKAFLGTIARTSSSYFWTLKSGQLAMERRWLQLARDALTRCAELSRNTTVSTAHNPIDYMVHGSRHVAQIYPAQAAERAAELLAEL